MSHRDFFFSFFALEPNGYSILLFFFFELNTKDSSSGSRGRGLERFACAPMYSLQAGSGPLLLAVLAGLQVSSPPSGLFRRTFQSAASSPGMFVELEARADRLPPSGHFERRAVDSGGVLHPRWVQIRAVIVRVWPSASLANLASLCWGGASYAQLKLALIIPRLGNTPPSLRFGRVWATGSFIVWKLGTFRPTLTQFPLAYIDF